MSAWHHRRPSRLITTAAGLLLAALPLLAAGAEGQERPAERRVDTALDDAARSFVAAPGFEVQDASGLASALQARYPDAAPGRRGADLTPIETAVLLLELKERPLSRTRFLLQVSGDAGRTLIEVARYNLGPALRLEAIKEYGQAAAANSASFGIGPHVVARYVFQRGPEAPAALIAAGRMTLSEPDAKLRTCAGRPCLGLSALVEELATWTEMGSAPVSGRRPYPKIIKTKEGPYTFEQEAPAQIVLGLALAADLAKSEGDRAIWTGPKRPGPVTLVVDRNLGQELMSDGMAGPLNDARPARWVRRGGAVNEGALVATRHEGTPRVP